jgi:predicted O-methyltransferase YrrM
MAFGASTLAFLAEKREAAIQGGTHVAIDPFQREHYDECGVVAVKQAALGQPFDFKGGFSSIELGKLLEAGRRFDLVYIDGSHLFEDAFVDAYFTVRLLRDGGVMLFDDCADRHVAKVLAFLRSNLHKSVREVDASRWRADEGKNWRYQIARRVGRAQLVAFQRLGEPQRDYGSELQAF